MAGRRQEWSSAAALYVLMACALVVLAMHAVAAEPTADHYDIQGTFFMLPQGVLQGSETTDFEYFPFTLSTRLLDVGAGGGGGWSQIMTTGFARLYARPPLATVDAADNAFSFKVAQLERVVTVSHRAVLPGDRLSIPQPMNGVYFESDGEGKLVRRQLQDIPPAGFSLQMRLASSPGVSHERLEALLKDTRVDLEFENEHLASICEFITRAFDAPIALDPAAVKPRATDPRPVSCAPRYVTDGMVSYVKLSNVPLEDALRALLRPIELGYELRPGYIWITSRDAIREGTDRHASGDGAVLTLSFEDVEVAERAIVPGAEYLNIGKPEMQTWTGTVEIPIPVEQWVLIALTEMQSQDAVEGQSAAAECVVLVRAHAVTEEDKS